jgi:peptide/nickel transport system substrate-binding protein
MTTGAVVLSEHNSSDDPQESEILQRTATMKNVCKFVLVASWLVIVTSGNIHAQQLYGSMKYGESKRPDTFDPVTSEDNMANVRLTTMLFEGLYEYNDRDQIEPRVATELPAISPDGKSAVVRLRAGIKWHDGKEVTAQDVVATFNAIKNAVGNNPQRMKEILGFITDVRTLSELEVKFTFGQPLNDPEMLLDRLTSKWFPLLPGHRVDNSLSNKSAFARQPLGSGIYKFVEVDPSGDIFLEAHVDGNARKEGPWIREITMVNIPDVNEQVSLLKSKGIDLVVETPPTQIPELETANLNVQPYNSRSFFFLAYNLRREMLKDPRLRLAMTLGFNRASALEEIYNNQGELISGPYPSTSPRKNPKLQPHPFSPDSARRLLAEAGLRAGAGGVLESRSGKPVEFHLYASAVAQSGSAQINKVVSRFQSDMKSLGINVIPHFEAPEQWQGRARVTHEFDIILGRWNFDEVFDVASLFHSREDREGGDNIGGYRNERLDRLGDQAKVTKEEQAAQEIHWKIHQILYDECPYTFLWRLKNVAAANKKIRRFRETVTSFRFFDNINSWYIR